MAAIRRNILDNATDRNNFIQGCLALKEERTGLFTNQLGIAAGPLASNRELSVWDLFVVWHMRAMRESSVDGQRNAAHVGPVFLPWHRFYLLLLEIQIRNVLDLGDDDFGLPYWDWAADGTQLTPAQQRTSAQLWTHIGGNGQGPVSEVQDGPFTADDFPVNVEQSPFGGDMRATNRGLRRRFGAEATRLPRQQDVDDALAESEYDSPNWNSASAGFRNSSEGWIPPTPGSRMHNRVHVWVGGDMGPGTSPNDPVFFLNHCFVDKIWDDWQTANPNAPYRPGGRSPSRADPLFRHRANDPMFSLFTSGEPPVSAMFDVSRFYTYA